MNSVELNEIGPLLRQLRISRGWTQGEVVRRLRQLGWPCSRSKYGKIESQGVRSLDFQILYFGRVFGDAFKEALWQLPLRPLDKEDTL